MKKKMVAVLLAAGLVISLAACGGASETGNTGKQRRGMREQQVMNRQKKQEIQKIQKNPH